MLTTLAGIRVEDLDTPAMLIDLDAMDRNIAHIAETLKAAGVNWRPHAKGHKTPAIAHRQIAAGAIGVTCAKLGEAEVFAQNGVRDILVASQVVGPIKTQRLAALIAATGADVIVAVDDAGNLREIDAAAARYGVRPRVVIEIDSGMQRAGVQPGAPTVELAKLAASLPNLRFAGVMSWEGHAVSMKEHDPRRAAIEQALALLADTADACRAAGLPVEIVSCGGSGTYLTASRQRGITEIQAGGATLGDIFYRELQSPAEPALSLMVQVISRPVPDRIIFDAGRKTIDPSNRAPEARNVAGVTGIGLSAEHGTLKLDRPNHDLKVGDRIFFDVGYHDQALHLHENLYAVRDGAVVGIWPTLARGKIQ